MIPKGTRYIRLTGLNSYLDKDLQIENGTERTPYEPYKQTLYPLHLGSIELNKIGDSEDYFYKDLASGKWYEKKHNYNELFKGLEDCYVVQQGNYVLWQRTPKYKFKANAQFICNRFINKANWLIDTESVSVGGANADKIQFKILAKRTNNQFTSQAINEWEKANNISVLYQLATPQDIEITNPELIEDLERLYKAKTFKPTTILTNNSIAILKLDYIADTKTYIDNKFKQMTAQIEQTNKAIVASEGGNV